MLEGLLSGLVSKEQKQQMAHDTIQDALENIAQELGCSAKDFFVMIKPSNEEFAPKFHIYKFENGVPKPVREISLAEIFV